MNLLDQHNFFSIFFSFILSDIEESIELINNPISNFAWGWPTITLISLTGIILMCGLKFMPIIRIPYGFKTLFRPSDAGEEGDITSYQALMTSLSATIGIGNIAGVASAIAVGGPGAIFWMWIISFFGIATKYSEAVLAVRYREVDLLGNYIGGPMYYIKNGLGSSWKWLGGLFAFFGVFAGFGIGNGVQASQVSSVLYTIGVPRLVTGIVLGILVFFVIIGGVKRIAQAASSIVPTMAILYIFSCLLILIINIDDLPKAFSTIFSNAFTGKAAAGGTLIQVILMGFKRGIFSNEAGLGSAPIAHASAKTNNPIKQGTVAMLGTFIDTHIICTMTALVIITTGAYQSGLHGANLSISAFDMALPGSGLIVTVGLVLFAFTTIIGWSFYGEKCTEYIFGTNAILPFRFLWVVVVIIGSILGDRGIVWAIADTLNGLMALPNLIALLLLSGTVIKLTREYNFENRSI